MNSFFYDIVKFFSVPINKEGYKFILIFALVTIVIGLFSNTLGLIGFVLTLWCIFFFRDPERVTPIEPGVIVSPADGMITKVEYDVEGLNVKPGKAKWNRVSIFLNVFDVHVNRVPISGEIVKVEYKPGKFLSANDEASSVENEKNIVVVRTGSGAEIGFVQVAGLIARRIISTLKEGQQVKTGERYGIIRFGSRVDIYLPDGMPITVLAGQKAVGGETIIARSER